jgi:AcrR family transcriptional regulator
VGTLTEAEERIIQAAIECIEEYGIQNSTIRKISEKANMNSAAISYYFRSKDNLIDKAMSVTLDNAFQWDDFKYTENMPLKEQLFEIFSFFSISALQFPKLTQAHFYDIINGNYETQTTMRINLFLQKVFGEFKRKKPDMPDDEIRTVLIDLASSTILYFAAFSNLFEGFSGFNMRDPETRKKYVRELIDRLIL